MNGTLWVLQGVLAFIFLGSGIAKTIMSKERLLATGQTGAAAMPRGFVRFIAICEITGAIGLVAPQALGIHPGLTALAALGFAIIMAGAAVVHYRLGEFRPIVVNALLLGLCLVVAYGRR